MSAMMSPPVGPPAGPPPTGAGHGPFSEEEIQEIMQETGAPYEAVCQAIDQTGAQTKEEVFPQFYSGQGIQPQQPAEGQTVAPGVVEGQPAADPAAMAAVPPSVAPAGEAGMSEGIDPAVAQAMHERMKPLPNYKRKA